MKPPKVRTVRAADLRRMAASSVEPERQRKMLALADVLEEKNGELVLSGEDRGPPIDA